MMEAGEDFVTIKETVGEDGKPNLSLRMDRKKLLTVGHPAIKKFLQKLQVGTIDSSIIAQMNGKAKIQRHLWLKPFYLASFYQNNYVNCSNFR
jgi:hypothetical protein